MGIGVTDDPREAVGEGRPVGLPRPPEVVLDEVDGVTAILPATPGEGEVTASLTFRVGAGDEPVVMRGITHLVEHLSLTTFSSERVQWNGYVDLSRTTFWAHGPADEVTRFLSQVTANLSALPASRVAHERRVLQVESQSREPSIFDAVLTTRYGLEGPGRCVLPEWGLEWLEADDLERWVATWFTRDNAALWSTAPLPGLELELPAGQPRPPELPPVMLDLPVVEGRRLGMVLMSSVVERSTTNTAAVRVLERRLRRRLRNEEGVSYSAYANYGPLTADHALVTASADVHSDHCEEATTGFLDVLDEIAEGGATREELEEDLRMLADGMRQDGSETGWMDRVALAVLFGDPDPLDTSFVSELEQLEPEEVAAGARAIRGASVLIVPECSEAIVGPPFRVRGPDRPVDPVEGSAARWRFAPLASTPKLVYCGDGMTHWDTPETSTTVRFDRCAGVVAWRDGTRLLYGTDGTMLYLDPEEWRHFDHVRETVDGHAPGPVAEVDRDPERDPDWARQARRWGLKRMAGQWLPAVLGVLVVVGAAIVVASGGEDALADRWRRGVVVWAGFYLLGWWYYHRDQKKRTELEST